MSGIELFVTSRGAQPREATTPKGLIQSTTVTQGSPALARKSGATLGWRTQFLCDWELPSRCAVIGESRHFEAAATMGWQIGEVAHLSNVEI
jgi:hypothetical protein